MVILPETIIQVLDCFAPLFSRRMWQWATVLVVGAILAPGKRTVTAALRVMGLSDEVHFQNYHRLLNRAVWSSRQVSRILLRLLLDAFVAPDATVVLGIDETVERRWGAKIAARGIYRDAVRSSKEFFVKTSGLRWISLMLLAPIPWIGRVWALPFLTVLAPSERYHAERQERHKKLTDWARQMILQVRRWLPGRRLVVVADGGYAVLELLAACRRLTNPVVMITRLRLDAALYDPAPPRKPGTNGRPRLKGERQPTLAARVVDPTTVWQRCAGELVWRRHPRGRTGQWHGRLVSRWPARRAHPLGADPGSLGPSSRPRPCSAPTWTVDTRTDRGLVCAALAGRGHVRRVPPPLGRRDAAPVVGPGDLAHHARPVGPVFAGDVVGSSSAARQGSADPAGGLVSEGHAQLLGRLGLLALTTVARQSYLAVACADRYRGNPTRSARLPDRYAGLRYLIRPAMDKVKLRVAQPVK